MLLFLGAGADVRAVDDCSIFSTEVADADVSLDVDSTGDGTLPVIVDTDVELIDWFKIDESLLLVLLLADAVSRSSVTKMEFSKALPQSVSVVFVVTVVQVVLSSLLKKAFGVHDDRNLICGLPVLQYTSIDEAARFGDRAYDLVSGVVQSNPISGQQSKEEQRAVYRHECFVCFKESDR